MTTPPGNAARGHAARVYAVFALALVVSRLLAGRLLLPYDDAFITFTYARNFAEGHGFVYYPGDYVLGTTAPLWGMLASLFYLIRLPMPESAVVLNALLDAAVLLVTLSWLPAEKRRNAGVIFLVLFAVSPVLSRVSVGAMETSLYLAVSVSAITLFLRNRAAAAFATASLAYFLRPEAMLLLAILAAIQIRRGPAAKTAGLATLSIACLAVPLGVIYFAYGQVLPQSVVAKSGAGSGLATVLDRFFAPDPLQLLLLVPAVWGGIMAWHLRRPAVRIVIVWAALYTGAYAVARPHVWSWYGVPVFYAVILLASLGLDDLLHRVRFPRLLTRAAVVLAFVPAVVWAGATVRLGNTPARLESRQRIAEWCRAAIDDRDISIAAADIGVIGYYSRARVLDLNGLVWPGAAGYDTWRAAIKREAPDYLFLNADRSTYDIMRDPEVGDYYRPVIRFSPHPDASLELTDRDLRAGWRPDYIVYRRVP